jgi:hypothetical protein
VPLIEIVLLDRPDLPSAGAGETPIVCAAGDRRAARASRQQSRLTPCPSARALARGT